MKYYAFISYKREDEWWAKWLQRKLEHYKLPSDFNGRSDLPKEIRPIFRDQSELAGGVLADEINKALQQSNYLIVICSPRAAQSEWVSKEVQTFIDLGRGDKIIPFIIGGTPHAANPEDECYPLTMREMPAEKELLGINVEDMGRDAAVVKVVAQMFHMTFGDLWHRFEREKIRNRTLTFAAMVFILIITAAIAFTMWSQNQEIKEKDHKMLENRSRLIAEKAQLMVNQGDPYSAHQRLLAVLPDSLGDPNPYTPEAGDALVYAIRNNNICINKHNDEVSSAFYSPDGRHIASTSSDGTIKIWNATTLAIEDSLKDNNYRVYYAAYSPDGKRIVSASDDDCVRIWDLKQGKLTRILRGHVKGINTAVFSPDGSRVLSASHDMTARVWYMDDCDTLAVPMKEIIKRCRDYYPKLTKEERIYYRID